MYSVPVGGLTHVSERLLMKHGFSRDDGNWLTPNGDPWEIEVLTPIDFDQLRECGGGYVECLRHRC